MTMTQPEEASVEATASDEEAKSDYVSEYSFDDLELSEGLKAGIADQGYERPTPVQAKVFAKGVEGKDLIVRSKTGTGKTAAFTMPLIQRLEPGSKKPQVIILCPVRELAVQVAEEVTALSKHTGHKVTTIYGGASMDKQRADLDAGVDFVVGTPGRVFDMMGRGYLDISECKARVLDEADEMLSAGFLEEVTRILDHTPEDSQTLLFSATVNEDVERIVKTYCDDAETILLSGDEYSVEGIENILYETRDDYPKPRNLLYLIEGVDPDAAIIFCNTRNDCSMVTAVLNRHGLDAEILNSDLNQSQREKVMGRIKQGDLRFMVATDLAARGIDISDLTHVINYSLPQDPSIYMHRVGRTGRIGKKGTAISLFGGADLATLRALEGTYGVEFDRRELPSPEEARKSWAERHMKELRSAMSEAVFEAYIPLVREIQEQPGGEHLLAFALRSFFSNRKKRPAMPRADDRPRSRDRDEDRNDRSGRGDRDDRRKRRSREDGEDRPRRTRRSRSSEESEAPREEAPASKTRLWVNQGSDAGHDDAGVIALLTEAAGLGADAITEVVLRGAHSFIEAKDEASAEALLGVDGQDVEGGALKVERAKPRRSGGGGGGGRGRGRGRRRS